MQATERGSSIGLLDYASDPVLAQIMPNRFILFLAILAGCIFGAIGLALVGLLRSGEGVNPTFGWSMLGLSAVVLVAGVRQLLWPVPLIEVTSRGVRLRIRSPMGRVGFLFVPWSHIRSIILTQTGSGHLEGGGRVPALGFQIIQDETIRLPNLRWNTCSVAIEAPKCDVAFSSNMIRGEVRDWVQRLEESRLRA